MRREPLPSTRRTPPGRPTAPGAPRFGVLGFGLLLALASGQGAVGGLLPSGLTARTAVAADGPAPHPVLRGFQPTGKYEFQAKPGSKPPAPPPEVSKPETPKKEGPTGEAPPKEAPKDAPPPAEPPAKPEVAPPPESKGTTEPTPDPKAEPPAEPAGTPGMDGGGEPAPSPDVKPPSKVRKTAPNGGPLIGPPPEPAPAPKVPETPTPKDPPAAKPGEAAAAPVRATVFYSRRAAAYLVIGSPLGRPFLVRTGMNAVESVPEDALLRRDDGSVDLRSDVTLTPLGAFTLVDSDIVIDVPGVAGRLTPPGLLLGWHTAADLVAHTPEYARDAKACPMDATCLSSVKTCSGEVRVVVYFGSWCSSCAQLLGRILRLEQEINKDAKEAGKPVIRFDYYGLPAPPATWTEPEAVRRDLDHLPTALVFVNGAYCTRIGAADLGRPDVALRAALTGR